jgi:hypothetical protein
MGTQRGGGVCDALLVARECLLDVELLELFERFIKHYVAVEHVVNDSFEAGAYLHRSICP